MYGMCTVVIVLVDFTVKTSFSLQIFTGNWDKETVKKHELNPSFEARYVRVYPKTWHSHICLRWEIYGCIIQDIKLK